MDCGKCSASEYFECLEDNVGTDFGDKVEFYAASLAVMDELADWNYVDRKESSSLARMVKGGCTACASGMLRKGVAAGLAEKVGGLFKSIPLRCIKC